MRSLILLVLLTATAWAQEMAEISGKVIDAGTRQPVAGARVVLFRLIENVGYGYKVFDTPLSPESPDPGSQVFSVETSETGVFHIRTTAPAVFMLFVSCSGYVKYGMDFETQRQYDVKPGQAAMAIIVELSKFVSVLGRVRDADTGSPLPGMHVQPLYWLTLDGARVLMATGDGGTTGEDGAYEIKGLKPGEYLLKATPDIREKFLPGGTAERFRERTERGYARTYYPGVERQEEAAPVTPLPGAKLDRNDIKMSKRRTAAVRGRIIAEEDPDTLGEVTVSLDSIAKQGPTVSYSSLAAGKYRAGESFRVDNLAAGHYWLYASAHESDPAKRLEAFTAFDADDRNVDNVDLHLTHGTSITGKVRRDESFTGPFSAQLGGSAALKVFLRPEQRCNYRSDTPASVAPADGAFRHEGVMDGAYRVDVVGLPAGLKAGEVLYNGARMPRRVFTVNPEALTQKLEVVLRPATASLTVSVRDGSDPAANAIVLLLAEDYDHADPQAGADARPADATGHATFSGVLASKYRVLAYPPGTAWRTLPSLAVHAFNAQEIAVAEGAAAPVEARLLTP